MDGLNSTSFDTGNSADLGSLDDTAAQSAKANWDQVMADAGPASDNTASAPDLIARATDPATSKVDTRQLAGLVADAAKQDFGKASAAYTDIRGQLGPDDAAHFDRDVRDASASTDDIAARAASDTTKGSSTGVAAGGKRVLINNPILTKQWENTASAWTGKSGLTQGLRDLLANNGIEIAPGTNQPPVGSLNRASGVPTAQANNTNGALARDAIAERFRAQGLSTRTEVEVQGGARRVDVQVDVPSQDPRMNQRIEIESKVGRTSQSPSIAAQAAKDGEALAENAAVRGTGRALETVGRAMRPVAVIADAVQLGQAFHEDGDHIGDHTGRAASGIAGGWGGAIAGAEGGAAVGAVVGSAVPVVGTAVGGVVGGVVGGIAGGVGGDWIGRRAYDWVKSWF